jgi:cation diffusion facilitator family transporter
MISDPAVERVGDERELFILKFSVVLTMICGISGVTIALLSDSMTLMLDGLYGIADIAVTLFAIIVVRKIHLPPNEKYNFGYAKYEPFMTAVDAILIMAICAATIISSVQDIIHPEPMENVHLAVIYAFISCLVSTTFGMYMKRVGRQSNSKILLVDSQFWIIEGIISLGVFVAFALSAYITTTHWKGYASYADPITCILLATLLLLKPISIIRESFYDLVDASPKELKGKIVSLASECAVEHQLKGVKSVKMRNAGRQLFVVMHFLADKSLMLDSTESVEQKIVDKVSKAHPEVDITVHFSGR